MALCNACGAQSRADEPLCDSCARAAVSQAGVAHVAGFRLLRQLGAGRFGASWLAHTAEGVAVAKILNARAPSADVVRSFLAEARAASELRGPSLARLLAAGQLDDGRLFVVSEYGGDQSIADVLRSQARLSAPRALDVCAEIADALEAAHDRGVVHRDLKAANVALWAEEDGSELARVLDLPTWTIHSRSGLREAGQLPLSSAATVSPEEARGEPVDLRADLYALGVVLYQALTGRLPITGMTSAELMKSHRDHAPLSLRDAGRKFPQLEDVVATLLRKDPAQRPSSAAEVAAWLRDLAPSVEDASNPRPARAPEPPAETPLPPGIVAFGEAAGPQGTAIIPPKAALRPDAQKTPPGGLAAHPVDDSDAPTPAEGLSLPTPEAGATPKHVPQVMPKPKATAATDIAPAALSRLVVKPKSLRDAELDPDRTPPDPVLAILEELPKPPAWLQEEAQHIAQKHNLQAHHARPAPPPPPPPSRPPPPAEGKTIPQEAPFDPASAPRQKAAALPAPDGAVAPGPAHQGQQATILGVPPPPPPPPKILRKRRGGNVAFSADHRATTLQKQLLKYGVGLVALLALLVFGVLALAKDPEPRRGRKAASASREVPRPAQADAAGEQ